MKKKVLFMSLLMSGVLAGCSLVQNPGTVDTDSEDEVSEDVTENEEPETDVDEETGADPEESTPDETAPNYEEIYGDVLNKMHRIIAHPESSAWDEDDGTLIIEEAANYNEYPLENIGYAFIDLSGDGFCELVLGSCLNNSYPGNTIHAVYTYQNGEVVYSFGGPSRNPHFLMNDGRILYYASNGYHSYGFGLSTLNSAGTALVSDELVYTGIGPDGETQVVFENNEGKWDEDSAYLSDMSLEDLDNAFENYMADTKFVELTPFALYTATDGFVGVEGIQPVYVSYADKNSLSDCEQYILDDNDYSEWISFYANASVQHFYVMKLNNVEIFDDGTFSYYADEMVEYDILEQGTEIAVKMILPETVPEYSISYFENDGTFHCYALIVNGEDGSVGLMDLN